MASLSGDARTLNYSTYWGGSGNEFAEHRMGLEPDGSALLTGVTASSNFPTTTGAYQRTLNGSHDGLLVGLAADGKSILFSTLLGGSGSEFLLYPWWDLGVTSTWSGKPPPATSPSPPTPFRLPMEAGRKTECLPSSARRFAADLCHFPGRQRRRPHPRTELRTGWGGVSGRRNHVEQLPGLGWGVPDRPVRNPRWLCGQARTGAEHDSAVWR